MVRLSIEIIPKDLNRFLSLLKETVEAEVVCSYGISTHYPNGQYVVVLTEKPIPRERIL